ncbi:hypothetical protein ECANGB1_2138 [Enterospora canceri]|uniref:Uncharacterized protein n=1 Tax=Enterospora canceri TaxID=1081671 RepID=A0A1Y1S4Z9_9MICR|nr:hypothetical protein ECANGB1_2138 [Enterospora canceri]
MYPNEYFNNGELTRIIREYWMGMHLYWITLLTKPIVKETNPSEGNKNSVKTNEENKPDQGSKQTDEQKPREKVKRKNSMDGWRPTFSEQSNIDVKD